MSSKADGVVVVLVVIVWWLKLWGRTPCMAMCARYIIMWYSLSVTCDRFSPVSSTNKTDRHDTTEILLKVALDTINQTLFCVFNTTFNNISAISWRSVLLVEETGVHGEENHRPVASHCKVYHIMLYWVDLAGAGFKIEYSSPDWDSNSQTALTA